jgi:hypothetical protein
LEISGLSKRVSEKYLDGMLHPSCSNVRTGCLAPRNIGKLSFRLDGKAGQ